MSKQKKIKLFSITLLLVLISAEVVSRFIIQTRFAPYQATLKVQGQGRFSNDPSMIWGNNPYYLEYEKRYQYNEYGIKSHPGKVKMPEKEKDDFWVFLLGGSAMAGKGSARHRGFLNITGVSAHDFPDTIEFHLQTLLQQSFPDKNVRVFNASVGSHTMAQTINNYERLRHLKPDWVVSMNANDGVILDENETSISARRKWWPTTPINVFPIKQFRMLAQQSAFAFLIGEYIFYETSLFNLPLNTPADPKKKEQWLNNPVETQPITPERMTNAPDYVKNSAEEYLRNFKMFQKILESDGQKHLLLVQPFLSMRDVSKMPDIERAVYNLLVTQINDYWGEVLTYKQYLYGLLSEKLIETKNAKTMKAVLDWEGWVFVDYCHFTKETNKRVAQEISKFIVSDGTYDPFPEN